MNGFFFKRLPLGGDKEKPVFFAQKRVKHGKGNAKRLPNGAYGKKNEKNSKNANFFCDWVLKKQKEYDIIHKIFIIYAVARAKVHTSH